LPGTAAPERKAADPPPRAPPANGFYRVLRLGAKRADVAPARTGEVILVDRHRYQKEGDREPPRYLAVHTTPDVPLLLAEGPEESKGEGGLLRIQFRLARPAAAKLGRLTKDHLGAEVAVVLGGEVVTVHKIRSAIPDGRVQVTCCTPGSCEFLLKELRKAVRRK
jgi:hypothetical protein